MSIRFYFLPYSQPSYCYEMFYIRIYAEIEWSFFNKYGFSTLADVILSPFDLAALAAAQSPCRSTRAKAKSSSSFHSQNCSDSKMIWKSSIFADASWWAPFVRFRRSGPMSSDLSYAVESGRFDVESRWARQAATHHQVDSQRKSRQRVAF